ncbi:unnamed protein product [Caenorhabditis bovis]|uniref:Purple acid phosphatase n=1 Tax=Caenorhabditis bovis TaxID=2654633 RepID=A0A8S1FEZ4_9PELO|nr:unnamed protein product [Caenorhabditis bovis]
MLFSILLVLATISEAVVQPKQVHLSLNGHAHQMVVTWHTNEQACKETQHVVYGTNPSQLGMTAKASMTEWKGGLKRYTFRATLTDLEKGCKYYYKVGSSEGFSDIFFFTQPDGNKPLRAAIFGDLSIYKGYSIKPLIYGTQKNQFDVVFHIGDIAYDLHDDDGKVGDEFMEAIEPIAAHVPYMVLPGNHETRYEYSHIINRYTMPKNGVYDNNLFWSLNYGNTHIIALNTEYYAEGKEKEAKAQYEWLKKDLENMKAKWTIVLVHRPLYCSTQSKHGCDDPQDTLPRKGNALFPGIEKLLYDHHVDLVFYGHKHTYERMWPMYNGDPHISNNPNHIINPKAPAYILVGSAGCHTHLGPQDSIPQPFSITRLGNYGYTVIQVFNSTHLRTHFVDASDDIGNRMDRFYIEKHY